MRGDRPAIAAISFELFAFSSRSTRSSVEATRRGAALAGVLEADERYEEAADLLAGLAAGGPGFRDRLAAARHALELNRQIDRR